MNKRSASGNWIFLRNSSAHLWSPFLIFGYCVYIFQNIWKITNICEIFLSNLSFYTVCQMVEINFTVLFLFKIIRGNQWTCWRKLYEELRLYSEINKYFTIWPVNLNKSEELVTNTTEVSKYIPTRGVIRGKAAKNLVFLLG